MKTKYFYMLLVVLAFIPNLAKATNFFSDLRVISTTIKEQEYEMKLEYSCNVEYREFEFYVEVPDGMIPFKNTQYDKWVLPDEGYEEKVSFSTENTSGTSNSNVYYIQGKPKEKCLYGTVQFVLKFRKNVDFGNFCFRGIRAYQYGGWGIYNGNNKIYRYQNPDFPHEVTSDGLDYSIDNISYYHKLAFNYPNLGKFNRVEFDLDIPNLLKVSTDEMKECQQQWNGHYHCVINSASMNWDISGPCFTVYVMAGFTDGIKYGHITNVKLFSANDEYIKVDDCEFKVNVYKRPIESITLPKELTLYKSETSKRIIPTEISPNGYTEDLKWSSSNEFIVKVEPVLNKHKSEAMIYPMSLGICPVTVSNQDGKISSTCIVTVKKEPRIVALCDTSRIYGDENPNFKANFYDHENNLYRTQMDMTVKTSATSKSPVGRYEVFPVIEDTDDFEYIKKSATLTVKKAPLTISADSYVIKQGEPMPIFGATYSGFKNAETKAVLSKQPVFSPSVSDTNVPGEYEILVSGADAQNYDVQYKSGTLTIYPADAVVVKVKNCSREYGEGNPTFEYETEGASLVGAPEIVCAADNSTSVGNYAIEISKGTIQNSYVTYVSGTLTITKAPLVISAGNYTKKFGEAMPEFKASYVGFKNGETESVLTKQPVFSTDATESSVPATYVVDVCDAEATNYEIIYESGMLTIVPNKKQTISWNDVLSPKVGETVTIGATASSGLDVEYSCVVPMGFKFPKINGSKVTFPESGNYLIVAIQRGSEEYAMVADTIQVNVIDGNEDILFIDGLYYKYVDDSHSALKVVRGYNPYSGMVRIPRKVNGLLVKGVDEMAFYACYYLNEIVVGDSVNECGPEAFGACQNLHKVTLPNNQGLSLTRYQFNCDDGLEEIHCRSLVPYDASDAAFNGFVDYEKCILYVPVGSKDAYGQAEGWKRFKHIVEEEATEIIVRAKSYSRPYGDANPVFEFETDGAALDGTPEVVCSAVANSPVGTYAIELKQGSVKNYNVHFENGTLTVTKAPLVISAGNYSKKQGDAMPEFKASYAGFKNGEDESVLTKQPVFSTDATVSSAPAEYAVNVSGAEAGNYDITYQPGTLTVTDADAIIIRAKSYSRQYGDANPVFEFETDGAALDGTPEVVCSAVANSPVGTYAIELKQGSVKNYNVHFENGTLTVTKAPLVISAGNYSKKQGDAMPEFKASYAGFKNGEDESVLTKQPVFSTDATVSSAPAEYAVNVSGAEAGNYDITYQSGILTIIAKAKQTISWDQEIVANVGSTIEMLASSSSGLPVRYVCYRPLTAFQESQISGNLVSFPQEGSYMLVAVQDGNADYEMVADTIQVNAIASGDGLMYIDGVYYRYTDNSLSSLMVVRGYKPYSGKVVIPSQVNGLPVNAIDARALYACYYLSEIVIGDHVKQCNVEAFGACQNLLKLTLPNNPELSLTDYQFNCDDGIKEIHCRSSIPYVANADLFNGFIDYDKCVLYVPIGSKEAYKHADEWSKFANIIEEKVSTGIVNVVTIQDNTSWYNLQGVRFSEKPTEPGIYIHGGKKIVIK